MIRAKAIKVMALISPTFRARILPILRASHLMQWCRSLMYVVQDIVEKELFY